MDAPPTRQAGLLEPIPNSFTDTPADRILGQSLFVSSAGLRTLRYFGDNTTACQTVRMVLANSAHRTHLSDSSGRTDHEHQDRQQTSTGRIWYHMASTGRQPSQRLQQRIDAHLPWLRHWIPRCQPLVRRLAGSLPDFDSIWLDVFVQQRLLTPWQAEQLQATSADRLSIGPYRLLTASGRNTFEAVRADRPDDRVILTSAGKHPSDSSVKDFVDRCNKVSSQAPICCQLPHDLIADADGEVWLATNYVVGWSLRELLIRGGRFPSSVVSEVGQQLLTATAWLETHGLVHGEIVTENIRITPRGAVVLVAAGAKQGSLSVSRQQHPETLHDCEGTAPESVLPNHIPGARSELYSLGALLWQLLAGRNVFLTADPVRRMLLQQQRDIPDVSNVAAECPSWIAAEIRSMTRRKPELRPASASDILPKWSDQNLGGRKAIRSLIDQLPERRPQETSGIPRRPRPAVSNTAAIVGLTTALLTASLLLPSQMPQLLQLMPSTEQPQAEAVTASATAEFTNYDAGSVRMPEADLDGTIRLTAGVAYTAFPVTAKHLRVVGSRQNPSIVLIPAGGWKLNAESIHLEGLIFQHTPDVNDTNEQQLVQVDTTDLTVESCRFTANRLNAGGGALVWETSSVQPARIVIRNSAFDGRGYGLSLTSPPAGISLANVLLASLGGGIRCELPSGHSAEFAPDVTNVTQRFGFSVIDLISLSAEAPATSLRLKTRDCVFAPTQAVIRFLPAAGQRGNRLQLRIDSHPAGYPPLRDPTAADAVWIDRDLKRSVLLGESQFTENMLLPATLEFADGPGSSSSDLLSGSQLVDFNGPKISGQLPGFRRMAP